MGFQERLDEMVKKISSMESKRIKVGELLRKINDSFKIGPNQEIIDTRIISPVSQDSLKDVSVLGVDGGIVKHSYHGLDLMLTRAVGVKFSYVNQKLKKVDYYPIQDPCQTQELS